MSSFVGGVALGLFYDYRFALSIFAFLPLVGGSAALMFLFDTKSKREKNESYKAANSVAEETFAGIRTVSSFGNEKRQIEVFREKLKKSLRVGIKFAPVKGFSMGFLAWFATEITFIKYLT